MHKSVSAWLLLLSLVTMSMHGHAERDRQSRADAAVANILFDYDYGSEFATYRVNEDGFVDIIMASNTPGKIYVEILDRLENHPDVDGVLASKSGPACKISNW